MSEIYESFFLGFSALKIIYFLNFFRLGPAYYSYIDSIMFGRNLLTSIVSNLWCNDWMLIVKSVKYVVGKNENENPVFIYICINKPV